MFSDLVSRGTFDSSLMIQLKYHLILPQAAQRAATGPTARAWCAYLALHVHPGGQQLRPIPYCLW